MYMYCPTQDEGDEEGGKDENGKELDPNNPREYIQKAAASMDDEYSQKKGSMQNYYTIAHTLREPVEEQPSLIVNGRLKQYQVRHLPITCMYMYMCGLW